MRSIRAPYEGDWDEIARLCLPARSEVLGQRGATLTGPSTGANAISANRKRRANTSMYSSKGRKAARILTGGMTSGLSSPSRPWFKLETRDRDMMEYQPVKEWLARVERQLYDFLSGSNFYNAAKIGYSELGCFGTEAAVMLEHPVYGAVTHALTAGEYWIANDDGLVADTLYRFVPMTVTQMVQSFAWDRLSKPVRDAYDKGNYETLVRVFHGIEPNDRRDHGKLDARNKSFRSVWWEADCDKKQGMLRESGYDEKPFWAPRWAETGGSIVYGDGPGMDALPDLRELQLAAKRQGRSVDMLDRPPIVAPAGMASTFLNVDPGSITYASATDASAVKRLFDPSFQNVNAIRDAKNEHAQDVMEAFYADLFMAISDMDGVQPRNEQELFLRNEEKLTQLGPVVERVNVEKLEVAIDRAFSILERTGRLPPPPEELQGEPLNIDFISTLAQAQRAVGLTAIQRTAQFVGFLAAQFPDAALKFDAEQAVDEFASGAGTPPKIVRSDEVVAKMREQMQQQAQQEKALAAMPAMQQGAQAAELLSRTNVGGQSLLERAGA
jgi:hypothetical protein